MSDSKNDLKILIVDDEEDLRDVLSFQLETVVGQIKTVANGRLALEAATHEGFDAVLSDINMPEMNGLELLATFRERGFQTPFVILTGYGDKAKAVHALRLGAYDFLEKPWDASVLRSVMSAAAAYGRGLRNVEAEIERIARELTRTDSKRSDALADAQDRLKRLRASYGKAGA